MEAPQAEGAQVDVPFAVGDLHEADGFLAEGLADIDSRLVPADSAVAAHPADLVMAGIVQGGEPSRVRSRRRGVDRGRSGIVERLVRAHGVVLLAPAIEAALLQPAAVPGRAGALPDVTSCSLKYAK